MQLLLQLRLTIAIPNTTTYIGMIIIITNIFAIINTILITTTATITYNNANRNIHITIATNTTTSTTVVQLI